MKGFKRTPNTSACVRAYFAKQQQHCRLKANRVRLVQVAIDMYASVAFIIIDLPNTAHVDRERAGYRFVCGFALIRVIFGVSCDGRKNK